MLQRVKYCSLPPSLILFFSHLRQQFHKDIRCNGNNSIYVTCTGQWMANSLSSRCVGLQWRVNTFPTCLFRRLPTVHQQLASYLSTAWALSNEHMHELLVSSVCSLLSQRSGVQTHFQVYVEIPVWQSCYHMDHFMWLRYKSQTVTIRTQYGIKSVSE
jgi:hypothetical protein